MSKFVGRKRELEELNRILSKREAQFILVYGRRGVGKTTQLIGDQPVILILDEFSYASESDPSLASHLQAAWDHLFKDSKVTIVLSGSHIGMMVDLMGYQAPLYGRFTAQLPVDPLLFSALYEFLPRYSAAERVAVYAVTGGVPAYLERFDDHRSLTDNSR